MQKSRRVFYSVLAIIYPIFFLLHWNGLFYQTYYWALQLMGAEKSAILQAIFAFVSSLILFAFVALIFELIIKLIGSGKISKSELA